MLIKKLLLFLLLAISFSGCNRDDDASWSPTASQVTDEEFAQNFGNEVNRDFIGQVVDVNSNPIQNATVKIGTATVQTDVNGVFIINGANVHERFAYVTAAKTGYINGSRSLVPTTGKNNIKIMLLPAAATQVISSGENSTVDLPNGTKVVFDGAFADQNGAAYTGNVSVSVFHLESSNENIGSLMPGMLYAKSESGQPVGLETFGMLHAELRGSGGQKLQIASGHTAQITFKIDDSQTATAPATIPLWHFDEVNGYWKQEGSATKQGNNYVGNVSHFSWWNCDAPFPTDSLTVIVKDSNGLPLKNVGVGISGANTSVQIISYTDNQGHVSGMVPSDQPLSVKIYNPCGNLIKENSIPAINQPTETNIILESTEIVSTLVKGKIVKCDGSDVTNGYVFLEFGTQMLFTEVSNGDFQFSAAICNGYNDFTIRGYDVDNIQTTGVISNAFKVGTTDLGIIPVCSSVTEYIVFKVNDYAPNYFFDNINSTPFQVGNPLSITCLPNHPFFAIYGSETTPGIYSGSEFQIGLSNLEQLNYHSYNFGVEPLSNTTMQVHILRYGGIGEYIDISFHINAFSGSTPVTVDGYVHVLHD
jgi:hypothetical protein